MTIGGPVQRHQSHGHPIGPAEPCRSGCCGCSPPDMTTGNFQEDGLFPPMSGMYRCGSTVYCTQPGGTVPHAPQRHWPAWR